MKAVFRKDFVTVSKKQRVDELKAGLLGYFPLNSGKCCFCCINMPSRQAPASFKGIDTPAGINSGLIIRKIKPEVLSENKDNHKSVHKTKKINLEGLW